MHSHSAGGVGILDVFTIAAVAFAALIYVGSALRNRERRPWPLRRSAYWVAGMLAILVATVGPIATAGHGSFSAHMVGHVLLGMLAPLLLVLAQPFTLALRSLEVVPARRLSALMRTSLVRFLVHPVTATTLNVAGLWLLYTTELYPAAHDNDLLLTFVHVHVLAAGYLFTASIVGVDPSPHRPEYAFRAVILLIAMAGHGILAKYLFGHPPLGVPASQAEVGSMVMYYGGDIIDLVLVIVLCHQWWISTRKHARSTNYTAFRR
jgi:putative membrane protein